MTYAVVALSVLLGAASTGKLSPTSDLSQNKVTATGSTTARSLANIAADEVRLAAFLPSGYVTDGSVDYDTQIAAAISEAQTAGKTLRLPAGTFKTTAPLSTHEINVIGEGPTKTKIDFYGAGTAFTFDTAKGNELSGLEIRSKAAGQTGLVVTGAHAIVRRVYVTDFGANGVQAGVANVSGLYYSRFSEVYVNNPNTQGAIGLLASGGFPSSNANHFRGVVVSGKWATMAQIDGTTNLIDGGDFDPNTASGTVNVIWQVNGSHNVIRGVYSEMAGGSTVAPAKLLVFGAASDGNLFADANIRYGGGSGNWQPTTHFQDLGWFNDVQVRPVGFNYPTLPTSTGLANLVPNSGFTAWNATDGRPWGWVIQSAGTTLAQETTTVRGSARSLKVSGTANGFNVAAFIYSSSVAEKSEQQIPIAYFQNQQVTCSVWCKSSFAGIGNVRVATNGTGGAAWGKVHHSGSGNWELLTASGRIPSDATKVWLELRASNGGGTLTGDVYFSEPLCVVGTRLPYYAPRALDDATAVMHGAFTLAPPVPLTYGTSIATDAALGNVFEVVPTNGTGYTLANPTNPRPGQCITIRTKNTFGALGTQSFGTAFKVSAWTQPANGFSRSFTACHDGTNWIETTRTPADVPN
jgi:hypothetical protein